jgi:DNA-binding winged helix-turn-helix (wHTH) protein
MIRSVMPRVFRFSAFELDVGAYQLRRAGEPLKLERLPMELLTVLVRQAGSLVDRDEIHRALWGTGVHVDRDAAINTAVRKLRHALGDDPQRPELIETVVGKGYRFIAAVERNEQRPPSLAMLVRVLRRGSQEFPLSEGQNLIGRDSHAAVHLDHPSVSRRHAMVRIEGAKATLEDLASRNGTFLEGRRVTGVVELQHGAVLGVGPLTLTFAKLSAAASTLPLSDHPSDRHDAEA